ncbi:hypothetical protein EVAR_10551_1 [Eumeta japonica]|uniref:Uncharacterized protein n=1 Tax=Eumeta variegata TaxID=151549 RepID=A0A4C1ZJQ3_EUMVA|nr:hypothetical protein EVAR_10551_1 [Eumeta japonica]
MLNSSQGTSSGLTFADRLYRKGFLKKGVKRFSNVHVCHRQEISSVEKRENARARRVRSRPCLWFFTRPRSAIFCYHRVTNWRVKVFLRQVFCDE